MADLAKIFADARAFREEAERARRLARTTSGQLQGELRQIAARYERLADGKDPETPVPRAVSRTASHALKQLARFSAAWPD